MIDGTSKDADELASALNYNFNTLSFDIRLANSESVFESGVHYPNAKIKNFNTYLQNTDSQSLGQVEITGTSHVISGLPHYAEPNRKSFVEEIISNRISYLLGNENTSELSKKDRSAEILSVLYFLASALKHEQNIDSQSISKISEIISQFDPHQQMSYWVSEKIIELSYRLLVESGNIEFTLGLLESLQLKDKLKQVNSNSRFLPELRELLSLEPLRSSNTNDSRRSESDLQNRQLNPNLKTAKDYRISYVSSDSSNFTRYQLVLNSLYGVPNILISGSTNGGSRVIGFETFNGKNYGGQRYQFKTVFKVDLNAQEGVDFVFEGPKIVWLNKSRLELSPEDLKLDLEDVVKAVKNNKFIDLNSSFDFRQYLRSLIAPWVENMLSQNSINKLETKKMAEDIFFLIQQFKLYTYINPKFFEYISKNQISTNDFYSLLVIYEEISPRSKIDFVNTNQEFIHYISDPQKIIAELNRLKSSKSLEDLKKLYSIFELLVNTKVLSALGNVQDINKIVEAFKLTSVDEVLALGDFTRLFDYRKWLDKKNNYFISMDMALLYKDFVSQLSSADPKIIQRALKALDKLTGSKIGLLFKEREFEILFERLAPDILKFAVSNDENIKHSLYFENLSLISFFMNRKILPEEQLRNLVNKEIENKNNSFKVRKNYLFHYMYLANFDVSKFIRNLHLVGFSTEELAEISKELKSYSNDSTVQMHRWIYRRIVALKEYKHFDNTIEEVMNLAKLKIIDINENDGFGFNPLIKAWSINQCRHEKTILY